MTTLPTLALTLLAGSSNLVPAPMEPPRKIVIAHRGASGYLPEHTLAAKAMAHAMGADYIEQDVVLSQDDIPVVLHDTQIDTVTDVARRFPGRARQDGRYYALDFSLAELRQLRVNERIDPKRGTPAFKGRFPPGQSSFQIATLEEELQLIQGINKSTGREAGIYPEIKRPAWHRRQGHDISKIVLAILNKYGYRTKADKVYVQCFDFSELRRVRTELGCQCKLIQLLGDGGDECANHPHLMTPGGLLEVAAVADGIGPSIRQVVAGKSRADARITDLVNNAHAAGLAVHPYTARADDLPPFAASIEELLDLVLVRAGADGIFTDHPDRATAFIRDKRHPSSP
ncbi:MAG TPA: glycerophosphodiester phosphodiesterase [Verrucomicrobiae bacterium]|nr:glycerophosphodiester phosphodiesterase [Verrucomicrobiae bacterium]